MDPFIGEIRAFGFNFAPQGWALCQGQSLNITQYQVLYSLLGTMYGGDGRTYFNLPDLRGRMPMSMGQGPGLTPRGQGQTVGQESVTIGVAQLPTHNHPATVTSTATLQAYKDVADQGDPTGNMLGGGTIYQDNGRSKVKMNTASVSVDTTVEIQNSGAQQPFNVVSPALVLNFCIALQGIYPARD